MNKKLFKKSRLAYTIGLLLFFMGTVSLFAQEKKFILHPITDPVITAAGLGLLVPSLIIKPQNPSYNGLPLNRNSVNAFDRFAMRPYSSALDITGDVFMIATLAVPAVLFAAPKGEWLTIGVMYAESVLFTFGLTGLVKNLVPRARPFMYFDNPPKKEIDSGDAYHSFFSRHTSLAFTGAAFASYVFSEYYPDSVWKIPVIAGSYAFAAATAALRVAGGSHFLTDVITGALVGTASGLLVPFLHKASLYESRKPSDGKSLSAVRLNASPGGLVCRMEF